MADLPRGTVTFLFTDIEGSTALWERDRQAMASVVARHLALLDVAISAQGSVHFKTVGDAVQAVFPTAPAAVAAALAAQRALLTEDWGEVDPLLVRVALHSGEAAPDERGDYLAAPLNRLSRLLSSGHGGQILLTQTVQQLARGALPAGAELRDLGEHRLRDLLEPERVFQLLHPDLPSEFPGIRTLEAHRHNLPLQLTPLVGREDDVTFIQTLITQQGTRLVTLTGPGGTGKTRLALAVAADLSDEFPDGVWFVDLAPLTDPALVLPTLAHTLGLRETGALSLQDALAAFLATKRSLVVLDNYEHLLAAAQLVSELLTSGPGTTVLVTSREPLRLRGEREVAVTPLAVPGVQHHLSRAGLTQNPAVALFVQQAQAAKADFVLTDDNADIVATICRHLDGLPLAIELAAARVKVLPPAALLSRLEARLPLLAGGPRDAPARQRTLRDTIAWSHDLLREEEYILFRRLGVFAGGWMLPAADTVVNSERSLDVLGGITSLVDKSLARQVDEADGEPRLAMLETIREFAQEQLAASGEEPVTREQHAAWVLALVEQAAPAMYGASQRTWWERLDAERPNIRSALAWFEQTADAERAQRLAWSVTTFCWLRGYHQEGQDWLSRALAIPGEASPATHALAVLGLGAMAVFRGDNHAAQAVIQESLAVSREANFAFGVAIAQYTLAHVMWAQGNFDQAMALGEEAILGLREVGDAGRLSMVLANMGTFALFNGDNERGEVWAAEGLALYRALGNR